MVLKIILIVVAALAGLILAHILWAILSVARGMRQRDRKLIARLEPVRRKLSSGETVTPDEIEALAARPELRFMLFSMLRERQRPELLPRDYSSSVAQGESALAYWMMHPHELQDTPAAIELVETIKRPIEGEESDFHVYRYRMTPGHWAAGESWLFGLAGPMHSGIEPYSKRPSAFSRASDIEGKVTPSELVDWYVDMLRRKGMIK